MKKALTDVVKWELLNISEVTIDTLIGSMHCCCEALIKNNRYVGIQKNTESQIGPEFFFFLFSLSLHCFVYTKNTNFIRLS